MRKLNNAMRLEIRCARRIRGITQGELSDAVGLNISKLENSDCEQYLAVETLHKIEAALGLQQDEICSLWNFGIDSWPAKIIPPNPCYKSYGLEEEAQRTLRLARTAYGLSQKELSKLVGVPIGRIFAIESKWPRVSPALLNKLEEVLGLPQNVLYSYSACSERVRKLDEIKVVASADAQKESVSDEELRARVEAATTSNNVEVTLRIDGFCRYCGAPFFAESRFCMRCGTEVR